MSYAVYTTLGWILGSVPSGEASKIYTIYSEDFGLIRARAQSVRLLASKLRFNLEDYSLVTFSLVRGKEFWKITGVEKVTLDPKYALVRARVLNLVKRLVQGEEKNEMLFQAMLGMSDLENPSTETAVLSKVLSSLGYLDLEKISGASDREVIQAINKALAETHL